MSNTLVPATAEAQQAKAEDYLDYFSRYATYRHRRHNPYLAWLKGKPSLKDDAMYRFFNFWYPVSRYQPQILLQIAAAYPEWRHRRLIMDNYLEEDGMVRVGDDPHYDLLEQLIRKLGGRLDIDPQAEQMVKKFHDSLKGMTAAEATGYVAAIEHPALDISDYFQQMARLKNRSDLVESDPYLAIHIHVEPKHIIWSHGNALDWMAHSEAQCLVVIGAFQRAMAFWEEFWHLAFQKMGYLQ